MRSDVFAVIPLPKEFIENSKGRHGHYEVGVYGDGVPSLERLLGEELLQVAMEQKVTKSPKVVLPEQAECLCELFSGALGMGERCHGGRDK